MVPSLRSARVAIELIEEETSIYDERIAVRRLAFRNCLQHPERVFVPMDSSVESMVALGPPPWLVGSMYVLVPSILDIHYWHKSPWRIFGGGREEGTEAQAANKSLSTMNEALRMLVHFEFLDSGQVQFRSRLLAPRAVEQWRHAQGDPSRLDASKMLVTLAMKRKKEWLAEKIPRLEELPPEAAVIQETLHGAFPMGPYHGSDLHQRLVTHQPALSRMLLIDPVTLLAKQHLAYSDLNPSFGGVPCPNPHVDPHTQELINVLCEYGGALARYHVISIQSVAESLQDSPIVGRRIASFMAPPTKLTSFAISEYHVIIPIHSLRYPKHRQPAMMNSHGRVHGIVDGMEESLEFEEHSDTLFYIISREYGQLVAVYRSEAAYMESVVNAFESTDHQSIYLDALVSTAPPLIRTIEALRRHDTHHFEQEAIHAAKSATLLRRYCFSRLGEEMARFDGAAGQLPVFPLALFHQLTDYPLQASVLPLPVTGAPYRYCYGLSVDRDNRGRPGFLPNALVKCDLAAPIKSQQWHRAGYYPSPPVFVPRSDLAYSPSTPAVTRRAYQSSMSEDDGVLVLVALDVMGQRSLLIVLDAKDLRELARYVLPRALPLTYSRPWFSVPPPASPAVIPSIESPEKTALLPKD